MASLLPIPRASITIRPGTAGDLPFIDALQKKHTRQVGWMPTAQIEGKIRLGHVLVAEEVEHGGSRIEDSAANRDGRAPSSTLHPPSSPRLPVGYCIGHDQYFKRDDVGIIYQLNVVPTRRRSLIGATLIKAMFDRAAYGCRLFCCWCAQDIEANDFWESLGFVPLAFRTGSRTKGKDGTPRVHIFWQRRIRAGDETTPYWFPSQTTSGSIREDRIVLPIPPGTHWRDAKPIVLPGAGAGAGAGGGGDRELEVTGQPKQIEGPRSRKKKSNSDPRAASSKAAITAGGLRFAAAKDAAGGSSGAKQKPKRGPRPKAKNDPVHVAAARELRDRWLEKVNEEPSLLASNGKYDVGRMLLGGPAPAPQESPALPAPMAA